MENILGSECILANNGDLFTSCLNVNFDREISSFFHPIILPFPVHVISTLILGFWYRLWYVDVLDSYLLLYLESIRLLLPQEMKSILHLSSDLVLTDGLLNSQIWIKIITALTHLYGFNLLEFFVEVHDIHVTEYNTHQKRRDGIRYRLPR